MPWGGPTIRAATTANVDATELWIKMIPMQIFGLVSLIGIAIYLGVVETKRLAKLGLVAAETEEADEEKSVDLSLKRPKLLWFNLIFTIVLIIALVQKWLPTYAVFMAVSYTHLDVYKRQVLCPA